MYEGMLLDLTYYTLFLIIATGLFSIIESIRPAYEMEFNRKEFVNDFLYTYLNTILGPIMTFIAIDYFNDDVLTNSPIPQLDTYISNLPFIVQLFIVLVVIDFAIYVRHRIMHEYLWPFHSIHHSLEQINWVAKFRLHPLESNIAMMFGVFFVYILGLEGQVVAAAAVVMFFFDISNHVNVNINFPKPLCYILSCPNYHKWHHAKEVEAINKNYVVMFPFIDKMFGTYYFPLDRLPYQCGIFYEKIDGKKYEMPQNFLFQLIYPFIYYYKKLKQFRVS